MNYNVKISKSEIEDFIESDTETPHTLKIINMIIKNDELIVDFIINR